MVCCNAQNTLGDIPLSILGAPSTKNTNGDSQTTARPEVVLTSDALFHPLFWLVMIVPASYLLCLWLVIGNETFQRKTLAAVLIWFMIFLSMMFILVIPAKYEVLSDASINIYNFLAMKWNFDRIRAVYEQQSYWTVSHLNLLKFACDPLNCVLVKRKQGTWDLLLSPAEPAAFANSVWSVVADNESELPHGYGEISIDCSM